MVSIVDSPHHHPSVPAPGRIEMNPSTMVELHPTLDILSSSLVVLRSASSLVVRLYISTVILVVRLYISTVILLLTMGTNHTHSTVMLWSSVVILTESN